MKFNLMQQQMALEDMNMNKEAVAAQRVVKDSLAKQTKEMGGVEAMEELMDELEDGMQEANDIGAALGREMNTGLDADEDDLLAELEGLESDSLAKQLGSVDLGKDPGLSMPSAPVSMPSAPKSKVMTEEEKELAELEKSMAM